MTSTTERPTAETSQRISHVWQARRRTLRAHGWQTADDVRWDCARCGAIHYGQQDTEPERFGCKP